MKVLITGGAGFIGANLTRLAVTDRTFSDIRVLDNLSTGKGSNLDGLDVRLVEGSVLDPETLRLAMTGVEAVVHLAALPSVPRSVADPLATHHANVTGTLEVLRAAVRHDVGHLIVASSSSVYGANPALPKREDFWTGPLSPYAASKLAAEAYALAFQTTFGLPTLAFRFFNVYGPWQRHDHPYAAVIPKFIHAALRNEPVTVFGDGHQSRDFTYVDTVCAVIVDALRRGICQPRPVNLAFGARTTLLGVLSELERALGRPVARKHAPARVGDVQHSQASCAALQALFPEVKPNPIASGIETTVDWFVRRIGGERESTRRVGAPC